MEARNNACLAALIAVITTGAVGGAEPHVTIDAGHAVEQIQHRAAGALYGFSNRTPNDETLRPLRPQFLRMASGRDSELASEDFSENPYCMFQMYDRAVELGIRRIEVMCNLYAPKTWLAWDTANPQRSLDLWLERLETIARLKVKRKYDLVYYDLFNEPDMNGSPEEAQVDRGKKGQKDGFTALGDGDWNAGFFLAWQKSCERVRAVDPAAKIVGPSLAHSAPLSGFLAYCRDHDCLPDVLSIHQLGHYNSVTPTIAELRDLMDELDIEPLPLSINEYASSRELGRPYPCCMYLCQIEREMVDAGILAYWFAPGTFGSLLNGYGQVRPGWWLYKWYGQMSGQRLTTERSTPFADALACLDHQRQEITILFTADERNAGPDGRIRIAHLDRISFVARWHDQCRITLTRTPYGVDQPAALIYSKNMPRQKTLDIVVPYLTNEAAFQIVIGPPTDQPDFNALVAVPVVPAQPPVEERPTKQGLNASLFHGSFQSLPELADLTDPKRSIVDAFEIHRETKRGKWHQPKIAGRFAVEFDGYISIPATNAYTFYLQSLGGSRLYINDHLVADNSTTPEVGPDQGQSQYQKELPEAHGQIALEQGFHRIRVHYHVRGVGELLVHYSSPSLPKRIIPGNSLWR